MKFHTGDRVRCIAPVDGREDIVGMGGVVISDKAERPQILFEHVPEEDSYGNTWFCDEDRLEPDSLINLRVAFSDVIF